MKHLLTHVAVTFADQGEPTIDLFAGKTRVCTVDFSAQPVERVEIPAEPEAPFELHFPTSMRELVLGLLQSGEDLEFDRDARTLRIGNARVRR